ncbi:MAG: phosphoribosylformylglycinamidine synthase [Chitinophagaceae bacterium]|nr:phosphoribosylformylglycinamidine synthase [Chitinophagaceae bacterium]
MKNLHAIKISLSYYYRLLPAFDEAKLLVIFLILGSFSLQAQTISPKKGIAGDMLNNADCIAADSLTWYYNWANTPNASVISTHQNYLEYCPMLWNGSWNPTALNNYLNAHPEVKYLLAFNEPNYSVQANMTPAQAAALWPQVEAIANAHNLKIVSPAMSYCSGTCLPGYNNQHGTVWLDDFFNACPGCRVDYIGLHVYDTWYWGFYGVTQLYKKYNRPIWITEFDYSGSNSAVDQASLMVDVIDYMEKDPNIFRYSWFLLRSSPSTTSTDIFSQTTGSLTNLGNIYLHMSSYDENYFHSVNATIEAEHYISKSVTYCDWNGSVCTWPYSIMLEPTTDVSGKLDAYHFASPVANTNDTLYYNVDIPTTQTYTIDFRVNSTAASTIAVRTFPGNVLLGTTASLNTAGGWQTKTLAGVNLSAGQQKIYLTASNGTPLKLNWLRINCSSSCGTLPVTLTSFAVSGLSNHSALLRWTTASEENNKEFIVEKSNNGKDFTPIGSVKAGTHLGMQEYDFTDETVSEPLNYYRLKQVDIDGHFSYSPIKSLSNTERHLVSVSSNTIVTDLETPQEIYYLMTTSTGQLIEQGSYRAEAGITEKKLLLPKLASGVYVVQLISQDISFSKKIIIQE